MRISILWRLALSFSVLILFSLIIGYKSINAMQSLKAETTEIYEHPFVFAKISRDVHIGIEEITLILHELIDGKEISELLHRETESYLILEDIKKDHVLLEKALIGEKVSFMAYLATFENFEKSMRVVLGFLKLGQCKEAQQTYTKKYTKYKQRLLLNIIALEEHADENAKILEKMGAENSNKRIKEFKILLGIVSLLGLLFSFSAYLHYIRPIRKFRDLIETISLGDTSKDIYGLDKKDEMGDVARSIKILNEHIETIVKHTDAIAHGDYSVELVQNSQKDKLVHSISLMTQNLKENFRENEKNIWIQVGRNTITDVLRENQNKDALGDRILIVLAEFTSAQVATLYLYENKMLVKKNGYAYIQSEVKLKDEYFMGEGIVGEAARKETITLIEDIPKNYMQVESALGRSTPRRLLLLPFYFKGKVKGLVELGYFGKIEPKVLELLDGIKEYLGIAYDNIDSKIEIKKSLEQEQVTSEELQAQEEELRVSNEKLVEQSKILKRQKENLEKTSSQLAQKAVDLELSSKYKSEFLANMSHELRTPLNSLLILSHSLAENESQSMRADEVESAQVIHESGEHLLSLINDILDVSKVEAGQMMVNDDNIDVQELLKSMGERFTHMANDKNIFYKSKVAEDSSVVFLSDRVKLGQIISNFISNAIKFTQEGGVTFEVKKLDNKLYFQVHDSGLGIPKEKQKLIFESFQQADGSTSRNYGGTGLGLSIALSFTKLLGGDIQLESKEGEGSTFSCILPFKMETTQKINIDDLEEKKSSFEDDRNILNAKKALFLIIEDDEKFSEILYKHIHTRGDQAIVTSDGETGIILANRYEFDGIILDYMLPGLDGHDVLKLLKVNEKTKNIPVHILSALNDLADMKELGAIGQDAKPISKKKIDTLLDSFTTNHVAEKMSIFTNQVKNEAIIVLENEKIALEGKKILLVDDDMRNAYSLAKVFRAKGLEVSIAPSGAKALNFLSEHQDMDVILMDIKMPEMDGYEVTRLVRAMDGYEDIPILAVTASAMLGDKEKCLEAGASDYMAKPIDIEKLFVMIQMWL